MAKVTHNMSALQNSLQKLILTTQILHITFFCPAEIFVNALAYELVFETMDCPANVSWKGTIILSIG